MKNHTIFGRSSSVSRKSIFNFDGGFQMSTTFLTLPKEDFINLNYAT